MRFEDISFPCEYGEKFRLRIYYDIPKLEYVVVLYLNINPNNIIPVRVHSACLTGDIFHSLKCDCSQQLRKSLEYIARIKMGMVLYLPQEGRGIGLVNKIKAYRLQQSRGLNTFEANTYLDLPVDNREYSICAEILNHFKVRKIELISNNPEKLRTFTQSPYISYIKRKRLHIEPNKHSIKYMKDKTLFFAKL